MSVSDAGVVIRLAVGPLRYCSSGVWELVSSTSVHGAAIGIVGHFVAYCCGHAFHSNATRRMRAYRCSRISVRSAVVF